MNIKVAIAEDNRFLLKTVLEKLSFFEDIQVKFHAFNGAEIIEKTSDDHNLNTILMDIEMPEMDGIAATAVIKQRYPQIKIIMLTVFDDEDKIFNAIKAGADGYLLKDVTADDLYKGIVETMSGGAAMTPSIALKTLKLLRNPIAEEESLEKIQLSEREIEVLEQLSKGLSYTVIAENLFLAPATIRKHIENIYKKLQVHSKLEAVEKAKKNKLI